MSLTRPQAVQITYDPTGTGSTATNVQDAITDLVNRTDVYTISGVVSSGSTDVNLGQTIPVDVGVVLYLNGLRQQDDTYTIQPTKLVLTEPATADYVFTVEVNNAITTIGLSTADRNLLTEGIDAANRAEAAADAAEDSIQYNYIVNNSSDLDSVFPTPVDGNTAYVRNTEEVWKYNASVWINFGLSPTAGKVSISEFDKRVPNFVQMDSQVALFKDAAGNVPLWLEGGDLAARGVAESFIALLSGRVLSRGLSSTAPQDSYIPLFKDDAGRVPLWLESGLLAARGLSPSLMQQVADDITAAYTSATDGRSLVRYRGAVANRLQSGSGVCRVVLTGDSWAEGNTIHRQLADVLYAQYGRSGEGWISVNGFLAHGMVLTKSGWTLYDASGEVAPTAGCGVDGHAISATGTSAVLSVSNIATQALRIFYRDTTGAWRWRVDGGSWTTVSGGGTNAVSSVLISGLADAAHTVDIDLTGNAGTVVIYGMHATRAAAGVEISKAGNGGITGTGMSSFAAANIPAFVSNLDPDLLILILGTNDYVQNKSIGSYIAGISAVVDAYRSESPALSVLLIHPAACNSAGAIPQSNYQAALHEYAVANGCEFLSLLDNFGDWETGNTFGLWSDNLHLSQSGSRMAAGLINKNFTRVE